MSPHVYIRTTTFRMFDKACPLCVCDFTRKFLHKYVEFASSISEYPYICNYVYVICQY